MMCIRCQLRLEVRCPNWLVSNGLDKDLGCNGKILDSGLLPHSQVPSPGGLAVSCIQTIEELRMFPVTWKIRSCSNNRPLVFKTRKTDSQEEAVKQTDGLYLTGKHSFQTYIQAMISERKSHEPSGNRFLTKTPKAMSF